MRLSCVSGGSEQSTTTKRPSSRRTVCPAATKRASHGWKCSMPKAKARGSSRHRRSPLTPARKARHAPRSLTSQPSVLACASSEKAWLQSVAQPGMQAGAAGGLGGSAGSAAVDTGRVKLGYGTSASCGSVGLHACAITEASMSPRRGGCSTSSQPLSWSASQVALSQPACSSCSILSVSRVRRSATATVASPCTSSTVIGVESAVGADGGAAARMAVGSIAPTFASGRRSSGAGRAKLSARAATSRATRSSGVPRKALAATHVIASSPAGSVNAARAPGAPAPSAVAPPPAPLSAAATASPSARASCGGTALPSSMNARDQTGSNSHSRGKV